jgi:photosystem II stability/assembly factor-like uncharacterized protein
MGSGGTDMGTGGAGPEAGGSPSGTGGGGTIPEPTGSWENVTSNLAGIPSECGTLCYVLAKPDEDLLFAGVSLNGLFTSKDGGKSWKPLGTGAGSDKINNRPSALIFDPDHPDVFWESGIYSGPGVFVTKDAGATFKRLGDFSSVDELSVDLADPDRKTMLAGGHENSQTLYRSTDGGATWTNVGKNMPAGTCTHPAIVDSQIHLVGCSGYAGGVAGILRTTDGGKTWSQATALGGGGRAHLQAADGTFYWLNALNGGLAMSTDQGETWKEVTPSGLVTAPVELPDGRLAAAADRIVISSDHGATWQPASPPFPPFQYAVPGLAYSTHQKAFFIWHEACGNGPPVPDDAVLRYDFDYEK